LLLVHSQGPHPPDARETSCRSGHYEIAPPPAEARAREKQATAKSAALASNRRSTSAPKLHHVPDNSWVRGQFEKLIERVQPNCSRLRSQRRTATAAFSGRGAIASIFLCRKRPAGCSHCCSAVVDDGSCQRLPQRHEKAAARSSLSRNTLVAACNSGASTYQIVGDPAQFCECSL